MEENKNCDMSITPVLLNPNAQGNTAFDLYSHLKCNIKCISSVCEIHDSNFTTYCLNCKRSICEVCKESFHSTHPTIEKNEVGMDKKHVDSIFNDLEKYIKSYDIFSNPKKIAEGLILNTTNEINSLQEKLERIKELRINKIKSFLCTTENSYSQYLLNHLSSTKQNLNGFFSEIKNFFYDKGINDDDCFIFLLNYEILTEGKQAVSNYKNTVEKIIKIQEKSEIMEKGLLRDIENEINKTYNRLMFKASQKESNLVLKNESVSKPASSSNTSNLIKSKNSSNNAKFSNLTTGSNTSSSIKTCINEKSKVNNDNSNASNNSVEVYTENNYSELQELYKQIEENKFIEMNNRIEFLKEHIKNFKETVYGSFQKHGSLVEVERIVKQMEETATKRMIHMQRSSLRFSQSKATKSQAGLIRSKAVLAIKPEIQNQAQIFDQPSSSKKSSANNKELNNNNKVTKNNDNNLTVTPKKRKKEENKMDKKLELFALSEEEDDDDEDNCQSNRKQSGIKLKNHQNISNKKMQNDNDSSTLSDDDKQSAINVQSESDSEDSNEDLFSEKQDIEVEIEKNRYRAQKKNRKLEKMFLPRKKELKMRKVYETVRKGETTSCDPGFMINNNLLELINENKRLLNLIKTETDINLKITTIRRYFSFETLEYLRKTLEYKDNHNVNHILLEDKSKEKLKEISIKIFEGKTDFHLLNKSDNKFNKYTIPFDKEKHKITYLPYGCRTLYFQDKLYITGGKNSKNDINLFLVFSPHENKLIRLADMLNPRSYHTMIYHDNLKSLVVVGGENNATCEIYDFYLNMWNSLPSMNIPRSNPLLYIDRIGAYAYAICGITGSIFGVGSNYTDALECLDLIDLSQGWERVDYFNKANVDLKQNELKLYPLTDEKLLIYGAHVVRHERRCHVMLDLKTFELQEVDDSGIELFKVKLLHPEK